MAVDPCGNTGREDILDMARHSRQAGNMHLIVSFAGFFELRAQSLKNNVGIPCKVTRSPDATFDEYLTMSTSLNSWTLVFLLEF
jgi:hypothetical protein